ncbi:UvrD-helicase domain-containing protein [Microcoleus sp. ZQ-A2]|nr:UvrD-helicase domain-containing protein [Microcoleus sp. FACHB-1]
MSTWTVTFTDTFLNELLHLPPDVSRRVSTKVRILATDPISAGGDAKKLQGYENVYRVRVSDYRLLYSFGQGWVKLLSVRHRKEAYKGIQSAADTLSLPFPPIALEPKATQAVVLTPIKVHSNESSSVDGFAQKIVTTALPYELTESLLKQWQIPPQYWSNLLSVPNAESILELPLPHKLLNRILDNLFPRSIEEIAIQAEYILKEPEDLDRFVEGDLIDFLLKLDPEQEKLLKRKSRGAMLIKGGPGTGKSILAIYRVQKLLEEGNTSILFTTYTNTLVNYSRQLLKQLLDQPPEAAGVEVTTVDSLVRRYYIEHYGEPNIADKNQCLGCLQTALDTIQIPARDESERKALQQQLEKLGLSYLLEEILNVIEGRGISAWEEYQTTKGNITGNIKKVIWSVYQTWRERMTHNCYITWEQMRRQSLEIVTQLSEKPYQALIVDEIQDLSPVALRFLLRLLPSLQGVYLTGDTSQSIYQQGFTWIKVDAELNLRGGRTRTLGRNYRNTQQIAAACATILKGTDAGDVECLVPESCAYQGDVPTRLLVDNQEQRIRAIQDFFTNAARQFRLPIHSGAVLCPTKQLGEEIASQLTNFGMKAEFVTREHLNLNQPCIKVLTIHSAKGLEFPFVAVVGLKEGLLPHIPPHLPSDEIPAAIDQQRRLFYVGCSRAMRSLMVCGSLSRPSQFLNSLCTPEWQRQECQ